MVGLLVAVVLVRGASLLVVAVTVVSVVVV
jgi:hypothetical protein